MEEHFEYPVEVLTTCVPFQAFFVRSRDLLQCDDPADATWETLPDGDDGTPAPPRAKAEAAAVVIHRRDVVCCKAVGRRRYMRGCDSSCAGLQAPGGGLCLGEEPQRGKGLSGNGNKGDWE